MLVKETKEKLEVLGFDVSKLEEAIKSDSEVSLDVPTLYKEKGISAEDQEIFGRNRFESGKSAMSEIKAKELKSNYGIDVEGKDIDKVISAIIDSKVKEVEGSPDERVKALELEKTTLQKRVLTLEGENQTIEKDFNSKLFNITTRDKIKSIIPKDGMKIGQEDLTTLFLNIHSVDKNESGSTVVKKGDQILKNNLEDPIKLEDAVNSFIDSGSYRVKNGMGGDDGNGGSSSTAKFSNTNEFIDYANKNGIDPMSAEGQKILADGKADDFKPSSRS